MAVVDPAAVFVAAVCVSVGVTVGLRSLIWHTDCMYNSPTSCMSTGSSRAGLDLKEMKTDIYPEYVLTHVHCSCGNDFYTRSTKPELHREICSQCPPLY